MLDVVYFVADDGAVVLIGVFLLPRHAEDFIKNNLCRQDYLIQTVSCWKEWSSIKDKTTVKKAVVQ